MIEEESSGEGALRASSSELKEEGQNKTPYRPTELEKDLPDQQLNRSKAPAVPAQMINNFDGVDKPAHTNNSVKDYVLLHEQKIIKSMSNTKIEESKSDKPVNHTEKDEANKVYEMKEKKLKDQSPISSSHPIPVPTKEDVGQKDRLQEPANSITDEVEEDHTSGTANVVEWFKDDEEAGGLPSPVERGSRAFRAMRQLLCCGVTLQRSSEEDISYDKDYAEANAGHKERKESSGQFAEYLEVVKLKDEYIQSQTVILERKVSVGPCFRHGMAPSGISISLPQKSSKCLRICSDRQYLQGININLSRKSVCGLCGVTRTIKEEIRPNPTMDVPDIKFVDRVRGILRSVFYRNRNL